MTDFWLSGVFFQALYSDFNKDWTCKDKDKDQDLKDQDKDKDLTPKDKDKDFIFFTMYKDLQQGWVSAGRNLFLPDMRFKPEKTWKLVSYRYE